MRCIEQFDFKGPLQMRLTLLYHFLPQVAFPINRNRLFLLTLGYLDIAPSGQ